MGAPATTGNLVNSLTGMAIGDYIKCKYTGTSGAAGTFSEFGTCTAAELPLTGSTTPNGLFYFVKVDKGLLIADRVIQTGITWDVLNTAKLIQGCPLNLSVVQTMTGASAPTPQVVTNDGQYDASTYASWRLFDGTNNTGWLTNSTEVGNCYIDLGVSVNICGYKVYQDTTGSGGQYATSWKLYVSNEVTPTTWTQVDYRTGQSTNLTSYKTFLLSTPVTCRHIRLELLTKGSGSYAWNCMGELIPIASECLIRSISGGVAYLSSGGGVQATDGNLGAFPSNNEWDKYIVQSTLNGKITAGDDNVWHWNGGATLYGTWCIESTYSGWNTGGSKIIRGADLSNVNKLNGINYFTNGDTRTQIGFRPVLQYPEDSHCTNVWY